MPRKPRHSALILSLLASLTSPALQAQDLSSALIEQGQYWQSRGDAQRAAEAWNKLLRVDPAQPDALNGLARAALMSKDYEAAERYLDQLRRAHPGHRHVARLQQDLALQRNGTQIQSARDLAKAGRSEQAVQSYQSALADREPTGPLAIEYYQTLGGTAGGWDAARRGLERLAKESPEDAKISLALAQHLTYREATRREGIGQLARLASNPDVGKAATDSWRKALAWTGSRASDAPLYQAFLRQNPGDAAVQARLKEIEVRQRQERVAATAVTRDPLRQRSQEGFKALDDGDLDLAEAQFRSVLDARPGDVDALGGMGVLRLRQEEFSQARNYLERASKTSPARWKQALHSATYWSLVGQARTAHETGETQTARQLLEQALRLDPKEISAENALADLLAETGHYEAAEAAYRRVLARQADDPEATRGLVGVLAQTGKGPEALRLVESLSPSQQEKVGSLGRLRATQALGQARAASAKGDDNAARMALEDALLSDPGNPWVRLDLARIYLKMGASAEARGIMDGLLISNPQMPEALYASALLASEAQDWSGALATLERIPEHNRTRDIASLQKRVWVHVQADLATALGREGRYQEAQAVLARAQPFVNQDAELLGTLALAQADAGDPSRALAMVREVLARTPRPDTGLRLQYAAALLKTQQDVELAGILRQLQEAPMSAVEQRAYEDIRRGYILRQADALRQGGDLASAYDMLAPLLAERPNDPAVVGALARMYADNGDHAQSLDLYNRLLEKDPKNLRLLLPAAEAGSAAKDFVFAESALQVALQLAPNDPEVLTAAGRVYRAKGQPSKAGQYFAAAVAAENQQRAAMLAASGQGATAGMVGGNPFRRAPGGLGPSPAQTAFAGYAGAQRPMGAALAPSVAPTVPLYIPAPAGSGRVSGQGAQTWAAPPVVAPQEYPTPATYYGGAQGAAVRPAAQPVSAPASKSAGVPQSAAALRSQSLPAAKAAGKATGAAYVPAPVGTTMPLAPATSQAALQSGALPVAAYAAAGRPQPLAASPSLWESAPLRQPAPARERTALEELSEIQQDRTATLTVGVAVRGRQGEAGMSQLTDLQAPVEYKFSAGDGMISLRATPTDLSTGTIDSSFGSLSRFGGGPATALDMPMRMPGSQSSSGVGLGVGYESASLSVDLGTLPLGFRRNDFMGGVRYKGSISDSASLTGELSRRPVTDSVLSFAGAEDARTGETWGAVAASGGRLGLTWDDGEFGVYGYGSLHGLSGHNVRSNSRAEAGGGMYWRVHRALDSTFTAGLNFTGLGYDKNLRYFTYGHGGYFSPQKFFSLSVPFDWSQRSGRLSYQIKGALGVQYFQEDAAPYFPGSSTRQAAAVQAASDAQAFGEFVSHPTAIYPGQSKTGLSYRLGMAMEYQLHPQLFIGGHMGMDNARDYRQFSGGIYLRYALQSITGKPSLPLNPLKSPYDF
ncbi:cellulose biosynthesis protein BcsC [Comamonas composti]|uniref:cellulose biosynthesis protein BcsC n=1 Tax=Comamonas composti TaxID=408558 RepID=UPI00040D885B|nr:cellulose biosynthesis protein BcsC [Comamonas composti]